MRDLAEYLLIAQSIFMTRNRPGCDRMQQVRRSVPHAFASNQATNSSQRRLHSCLEVGLKTTRMTATQLPAAQH
jgi:hypothetical protein